MKTNRTKTGNETQARTPAMKASTAATKARTQSGRPQRSSGSKIASRARADHAQEAVPESVVPALNKKATIEALMRRPEGTAVAELMAATGWQEHSIRAALTGLRKAGCTITRDRNDGPTRYRIVGAV